MSVSFVRLEKIFAIIFSNILSAPFPLSFPSGTHIMQMLECMILPQRSLTLLFQKILFSFLLFRLGHLQYPVFQSVLLISVLTNLLSLSPNIFFISGIIFFISDQFSIIFSNSVKVLPEFFYLALKLVEHPYDSFFGCFIKKLLISI